MNFYYFAEYHAVLPIKQLLSMASFKNLAVGDIAVLRIDHRIIMIYINQALHNVLYLSDYPMVAQVVCEDENLPKLLPMIYYNDGYREKIIDFAGLHSIQELFSKELLAAYIIHETLLLATGKIDKRDVSLTLKLMGCNKQIPRISQEKVLAIKNDAKDGKLFIVEKHFNEKMKQEFYNNLSLGLSERESLVLVRRKFTKAFSKILIEFKDKDIYTRL